MALLRRRVESRAHTELTNGSVLERGQPLPSCLAGISI
jgi:hypothetical protein